MALQKSRKSRARRGMRRAHDSLTSVAISVDSTTGEKHRRHHISASGYYRGKQIVKTADLENDEE